MWIYSLEVIKRAESLLVLVFKQGFHSTTQMEGELSFKCYRDKYDAYKPNAIKVTAFCAPHHCPKDWTLSLALYHQTNSLVLTLLLPTELGPHFYSVQWNYYKKH